MTPLAITGYGACRPVELRPSSAIDALLEKPDGWTETQFGIAARGVASPEESSSVMGAAAARQALEMAGWGAGEFDVLIGACGVMEQPIPGTSVLIQNELGLGGSGVWAFDVNQTCLSFLTALDVVAMGFASGRFRRALVVCSDIPSMGLDWGTPTTAAIFGDGAAAVCLEARSDPAGPGLLSRRFETYGHGKDLAFVRSGGTRVRAADDIEAWLEGSVFRMDPFGIFKAAARFMPRLIDDALTEAGLTRDTVDLIVPHQASRAALEHLKRLMGGDPNRVMDIFSDHGNQIAASLPSVLVAAHRSGRLAPGTSVLLVGTAAGISGAAVVLRI